MSKISKPLVLFNPKLPKLSKNEQKVLNLLVEAGKLIVPLYSEQENHQSPGANFYPQKITKKEIEAAAKGNPEILSPYAVVEKVKGKLVAVPYHQKYAKLLKPVADKLLEAAEVTDNKEIAKRLKMQAKALLDGSYEDATVFWMSMKPYILDIVIGPIERYDDRLFFVKAAYQAWVGVMDEEQTRRMNEYKKIILSSRRRVLMASDKVDYYGKVQLRIDNAVLYSGRISRTLPVGINLPNDPNLMERLGSEITIFKQVNEIRFKEEILPTFNKIFSSEFKKIFQSSELEEGSLYSVIMHELAHIYLRYRNSERNLKDLFPIIDELSASVMGIKVCGSLLLKDILSQKQLESIMIAFMSRCFYLILHSQDMARIHYTIGGAIFINFLLESGAVKAEGGVSWPNFMKMFVSLDELASILERLLYQGSRDDAETFIAKYGKIQNLQRLI